MLLLLLEPLLVLLVVQVLQLAVLQLVQVLLVAVMTVLAARVAERGASGPHRQRAVPRLRQTAGRTIPFATVHPRGMM